MLRRRPSWTAVLLGVAALLGQLLLPLVHAQGRALRGADPLLYAYCGGPPAALARRLPAAGPAVAGQPRRDEPRCAWCGVLHAGHHAAAAPLPLRLRPLPPPRHAPARLGAAPTVRLVRLPGLRGPPPSL